MRHLNQEQLELIREFKLGCLNQDRTCKITINHFRIIKLKIEIEHRVPIRILIEILFIYIDLKYKYLIFYNIFIFLNFFEEI